MYSIYMTEKSPESYSEVKIFYQHPSPPNQAEVTETPKSQGRDLRAQQNLRKLIEKLAPRQKKNLKMHL